jgi:RecA-family ATPase
MTAATPGYEEARGQRQEQARQQKANGAAAPPDIPPLVTAAEFVAGYVAPDYAIDGLIQRSRVYALTAKTGHGKTAVGLALAFAKALGRSVDGRHVEPGRVVYLAAENPDDIKARTILMADRLGLNLVTLPLRFVEGAFNIRHGLALLGARVTGIGGAELVIVDTGAAFPRRIRRRR